MAIDEDIVTRAFINMVKTAIGTSLAEVGATGAKTPAVIKTRVGKRAPDYPYVVVKLEDRISKSPHLMHSEVSDADLTSYNRIESFMYSFRCYGTDSINIINNLHQYLTIPNSLDLLRTATGGAVTEVDDPRPLPVAIGGDYIESSIFMLSWASYSSIEDPNSSLIENFTLTYNIN